MISAIGAVDLQVNGWLTKSDWGRNPVGLPDDSEVDPLWPRSSVVSVAYCDVAPWRLPVSGSQSLADGLLRGGLDVATVTVLAVGLFQRRHARPDLTAVFVSFNVGLFAVLTFLSSSQLSAGVGFGVFGVLSIIRLRSETYANVEIAYFFLTLATALVNALPGRPLALSASLDIAILLTLALVDSPTLHDGTATSLVLLDTVHSEQARLHEDLARRLSGDIISTKVLEVDYVRETMRIEVRHRPLASPAALVRA